MRKISLLLMVLAVSVILTGCETLKGTVTGAAAGMGKDAQNLSNPAKNGWNTAKKADTWIQNNLW